MSLARPEREVLGLANWLDMSPAQVALITGLAVPDLRVMLGQAREQLAGAVAAEVLAGPDAGECESRAAILGERPGVLSYAVRRRLLIHAECCPDCAPILPRGVSPAKVYRLLPFPEPGESLAAQLRAVAPDAVPGPDGAAGAAPASAAPASPAVSPAVSAAAAGGLAGDRLTAGGKAPGQRGEPAEEVGRVADGSGRGGTPGWSPPSQPLGAWPGQAHGQPDRTAAPVPAGPVPAGPTLSAPVPSTVSPSTVSPSAVSPSAVSPSGVSLPAGPASPPGSGLGDSSEDGADLAGRDPSGRDGSPGEGELVGPVVLLPARREPRELALGERLPVRSAGQRAHPRRGRRHTGRWACVGAVVVASAMVAGGARLSGGMPGTRQPVMGWEPGGGWPPPGGPGGAATSPGQQGGAGQQQPPPPAGHRQRRQRMTGVGNWQPGGGGLLVWPGSLQLAPGFSGQIDLVAAHGPVRWSARSSSPLVALSAVTGTLASGQQTALTATVRASGSGSAVVEIWPGAVLVQVSWGTAGSSSCPPTSPPPTPTPPPTPGSTGSPSPSPSPQSPVPSPSPSPQSPAASPSGSASPSGQGSPPSSPTAPGSPSASPSASGSPPASPTVSGSASASGSPPPRMSPASPRGWYAARPPWGGC